MKKSLSEYVTERIRRNKIIYEHKIINPKVLVCKKCRHPVEKGSLGFYSCKECDAWVVDVEWEEQKIT